MRIALIAVSRNRPDGQVQPVEVLRARVAVAVDAYNRCDPGDEVGTTLPDLVLGFGPEDVGQWRVRIVLQTGDHEQAARIAEDLRPETHLLRARQADYWVCYGQSLSRLRGRYEEAVQALRRAELISPHHVLRDPITRELLSRLRPDSPAGRELRGMAYRAGLPG